MSSVSGFLSKTFEIFSDTSHEDICGWGPNGDTIQVKKIEEFSKKILPLYFKHSNFQSFVRQLNMYDFHKTVQDPGNGEFQHMYFLKNRPDLLHLIKRKAHTRQVDATKSGKTPTSSYRGGGEGSGLDLIAHGAELVHGIDGVGVDSLSQMAMKSDLERRLTQLDQQKRRVLELEAQQLRLSEENIVLKHLLDDTRAKQDDLMQKMEGVLKLLYHLFVSAGNGKSIPTGSLSGIPESRLLEFCRFLNIGSPHLRRSALEEMPMSTYQITGGGPVGRSGSSFTSQASSSSVPLGHSTEGRPLEKVFSFDSFANSFSLPNASDSYYQQVPPEASTPAPYGPPPPRHPQEGQALMRITDSIDAPTSSLSTANAKREPLEGEGQPARDSKRLRTDKSVAQPNGSALDLAGAPLQRRSSSGVPLARLDSLESTLASLLDFDEEGNIINVDDGPPAPPPTVAAEGPVEE